MQTNKEQKEFILMIGPKCFVFKYEDGKLSLITKRTNAFTSNDLKTLYLFKGLITQQFGLNCVLEPAGKK